MLQNTLIMDENLNVFAENQNYFRPFVESERVGVDPVRRDLNEGKGVGD